jgi:peptidoglycan/LPS O-acetylase OafA/YrhL
LRILPLALLAILFAYFVVPALGADFRSERQVPFLAYLLFINNFWTASGVSAYRPLGPLWSLAIEEQFYLVAPAFILLVSHRKWIAALGFIVLASPWIRSFSPGFSPWDFTPYRLDGLSVGMLAAVLLRDQRFLDYAMANKWKITAFASAAVSASLLFAMSSELSASQRIAFGISLNSLAAASTIVYLSFNQKSPLSWALSCTWLTTLGRWSYFLYLMHMPLLICVGSSGLPRSLQPAVALAVCLVGGWVSWRYLESPLIDRGKETKYHGL